MVTTDKIGTIIFIIIELGIIKSANFGLIIFHGTCDNSETLREAGIRFLIAIWVVG